MTPTVQVARRAADRVLSGHPWVFASDVLERNGAGRGEVVRVTDPRGRLLGMAHHSTSSQIALRLLSPKEEEINRDFFRARLEAALALRERVVEYSDAYRLVHAEGDLLPGLIVDRYADCVVIQALNQGMAREQETLVSLLQETLAPAAIVARNDSPVRAKEELPLEKRVVAGELPEVVALRMNGLAWRADLLQGQKTGVFLDQRENYLAVRRHARGDALDCFTSTGGFALHAAGACRTVEAVDSSEEALATAIANRDDNGIGNVQFRKADVFDLLPSYVAARRQFQTIILDPPAFAKSRAAVDGALRGYREINQRALRLLSPGGVLVTCSCSHHVSEADLLGVVAQAAVDARRTLRVLERRTQAADHPILLTVPETHYLKCLVLQAI